MSKKSGSTFGYSVTSVDGKRPNRPASASCVDCTECSSCTNCSWPTNCAGTANCHTPTNTLELLASSKPKI